jgi:hypothetical protein
MAIFGLAAISTSLAYIIYFRVLATAGATNLLLVTFLIPLSAILLGVMVLGEQLGWNAFVGMGLIFMGLITIDGRLLKRLKNPAASYGERARYFRSILNHFTYLCQNSMSTLTIFVVFSAGEPYSATHSPSTKF